MQAVGHDFKMHEQFWRGPGSARRVFYAVEEKLQDAYRKIHFQIKRAVHKFKVTSAALIECVHLGHKAVQLESPGGLVQRTQAELAFKWAAA